MFNQNDLPALIPPHGGYRKLRSYQVFEAFLRQRGLNIWAKDSPEALAIRKKNLSDRADLSDLSDPELAANTLICLVNQASYLLRRQLRNLEQQFLTEGGFTERLYKARTQARSWRKP